MPPKTADISGQRFGEYVVLGIGPRYRTPSNPEGGGYLWLCRCDCGVERLVSSNNLKRGHSKSCGHARVKHGEYVGSKKKPSTELSSYTRMLERCTNKNSHAWSYYGGRGIKVCARWLESFENFLEDMGRKPTSGHSIDRVDPNGNYEQGNCRWATHKEQAQTRRPPRKRKLFANGETVKQ